MTNRYLRYAFMGTLALSLSLPLCGTARADHDYSDECHQRLQAQKDKIDRDAAKYGEHSSQVDHDVAKLEQERQWCRDHKADWDHGVFDVGIYLHK